MQPIPQDWIRTHYVDVLLRAAEVMGPDSRQGKACLLKAEHIDDMVKAFNEEMAKAQEKVG